MISDDIKTSTSWKLVNKMLQSYEAIIENGQVKWFTDAPKVSKAHIRQLVYLPSTKTLSTG